MRVWGAGLLVAGLAATLSGGATALAVAGADQVPDGALPFVAKVLVGDARSCTGALVAPRWIVTAKSCFSDGSAPVVAGVPTEPTTVLVGRADLTKPTGRRLAVTSIVPQPDRNVLLAELSAPVAGIAPAGLDGGPPRAGETLRIAGFGRTGTEWIPDRLHAAGFTVGSVEPGSFAVTGVSSGATLCKGDAGGPAFRETSDGVQLVGISDASRQSGCLGEPVDETAADGSEARTDDLADWIRSTTAVQPAGLREPVTGEFTRDGRADLVAADAAGSLWLYPGTATRNAWAPRVQIGSGWAGFRDLVVGRINRDGFDDLVAIESASGKLWLYPGTAAGVKFGTRVQIGSGWTDFRDLAVGRVNRDEFDDLLTVKDSTQQLFLYAGNAAGGNFNAGVVYGSGWGCCKQLTVGRFNDDGFADLLTVESATGKMRIYPGTAAGDNFGPGTDAGAGSGWLSRSETAAVTFGAESRSGLLAKDSSGALLLFPAGAAIDWSDPITFGPTLPTA